MPCGRRKINLSFKTSSCVKEALKNASKALGMNLSNVCEALISCLISYVEGGVGKREIRFLNDYWSVVRGPCNDGKRVVTVSIRIAPDRKERLIKLIERMKAMNMCESTSSCLHEIFQKSLDKDKFMELVSLLEGFAYNEHISGDKNWKEDWFEESGGN